MSPLRKSPSSTWPESPHVGTCRPGRWVDRLPELIAKSADAIGEHIGIPGELIRLVGAILPTTCATSTLRTRSFATSCPAPSDRGRRRSWRSRSSCSRCTGIPPSSKAQAP